MLVWGEIEVELVFLVVIGGVVVTLSSYGCVVVVVLVEEQVVELVDGSTHLASTVALLHDDVVTAGDSSVGLGGASGKQLTDLGLQGSAGQRGFVADSRSIRGRRCGHSGQRRGDVRGSGH